MFGVIDIAKVVIARLALFQVRGKDRGSKGGYGILEKCLDLVWTRRVDAIECKAKQTIIVGVRLELSADSLRCLDSLAGHGGTTDDDFVEVDVA